MGARFRLLGDIEVYLDGRPLEPGPGCPDFDPDREPVGLSPRSAAAWTACRWRLSWPPPGCAP